MDTAVDLYWIPLGAGGAAVVRASGRLYEVIASRRRRRRPMDLYHTALEVSVDGARFTIENAWPSPDGDFEARGVVVEGPVGSRQLARLRLFRYEVRCWRDGVIPDIGEAVGGPRRLSADPAVARRLLALVPSVPVLRWGRTVDGAGEMWNSNSVVSYLLAASGLPAAGVAPPPNGRAPGWRAGIVVASRLSPAVIA